MAAYTVRRSGDGEAIRNHQREAREPKGKDHVDADAVSGIERQHAGLLNEGDGIRYRHPEASCDRWNGRGHIGFVDCDRHIDVDGRPGLTPDGVRDPADDGVRDPEQFESFGNVANGVIERRHRDRWRSASCMRATPAVSIARRRDSGGSS